LREPPLPGVDRFGLERFERRWRGVVKREAQMPRGVHQRIERP